MRSLLINATLGLGRFSGGREHEKELRSWRELPRRMLDECLSQLSVGVQICPPPPPSPKPTVPPPHPQTMRTLWGLSSGALQSPPSPPVTFGLLLNCRECKSIQGRQNNCTIGSEQFNISCLSLRVSDV